MNKFIIGFTVVVVVAAIVYLAVSKSKTAVAPTPEASATPTESVSVSPTPSASTTASPTYTPVTKLVVQTMVAGTGTGAKTGDTLSVKYKGMLVDGRGFDSNTQSSSTFDVKLGEGRGIKGWEQGLVGIKKGEKRRLIIPPDLAYGATGVSGSIIGANATLVFEVEAVNITTK